MSDQKLRRASISVSKKDAHKEWLKRGRKGAGRMHVEYKRILHPQLGAWGLTASRWVGCTFEQGYAVSVHFEEAEFEKCVWSSPNFLMAKFTGAHLTDTVFHDAKMALSWASGLRIHRGSLIGAQIEKADWQKVELRHVDLSGARMNGIELQHSIIENCTLRDVDLSDAVLDGARFVDCDLRGATLPEDIVCIDCLREA